MINENNDKIRLILRTLPDKPGIYQYFDKDGKILYIGKAKNLKKRVSSYFNKEHDSGRLNMLVRKIAEIRHMVVDSEFDALLLENSLIKEHQPRYNVMLKDDKSFPWICIKNEPFPRVFAMRNPVDDGSKYYGPYASARAMKTLLELIRQIYPIRTCKLNLTQKNITAGKFRVCLQYHIGNCLGPCEGHQEEEDYKRNIRHVVDIIKGNLGIVINEFKERMMQHAEKFEFERAQAIKEKIALLERYKAKSVVVSSKISDIDVFSIINDPDTAYVNYMKILHGAIVQGYTLELKKKLDESSEELLAFAITNLRSRFFSESPEIIVPIDLGFEIPGVKVTVPQIGDKKHLLDLSLKNAQFYRVEKEKQEELVDPERHSKRILATMMKDLRMKEPPAHIECFDNSNIQGDHAVAAMVCFKNAKPDKREYRHFNIKTVTGPDDFASMEEIIHRRYKRLLDENLPLPQLIVIDGGKGQLSAALKSLEKLGLRGKMTIIGIAKKLEEIYYPQDSLPMYLDKKSETLKVLQRIRDEAHRFGITHHRKKREKATIKTDLTGIKGIGRAIADKLLKEFKSVKAIEQASEEELAKVIGKAKAKLVKNWAHQ